MWLRLWHRLRRCRWLYAGRCWQPCPSPTQIVRPQLMILVSSSSSAQLASTKNGLSDQPKTSPAFGDIRSDAECRALEQASANGSGKRCEAVCFAAMHVTKLHIGDAGGENASPSCQSRTRVASHCGPSCPPLTSLHVCLYD